MVLQAIRSVQSWSTARLGSSDLVTSDFSLPLYVVASHSLCLFFSLAFCLFAAMSLCLFVRLYLCLIPFYSPSPFPIPFPFPCPSPFPFPRPASGLGRSRAAKSISLHVCHIDSENAYCIGLLFVLLCLHFRQKVNI